MTQCSEKQPTSQRLVQNPESFLRAGSCQNSLMNHGSKYIISALAEARLNRSNFFTSSQPQLAEAGLTLIFSSMGELESRNLIKSTSDLILEMPVIFTRRSWAKGPLQLSSAQNLVFPAGWSSGRTYKCMVSESWIYDRIADWNYNFLE